MADARAFHRLYQLRGSYWFLPSVMVFAAVALATGLIAVDAHLTGEEARMSPTTARDIFTTIAGAMIGVAGVAFSMTMVAVSFAGGQFGPRLIGNFMRDQGNQVSLGAFAATFVYCVAALRWVGDAGSFDPWLSTHGALVLTGGCIGVFIYFIHHVPETINVGNITASVGRRLQAMLRDGPFPRGAGKSVTTSATPRLEHRICTDETGYVARVEVEALIELARAHDTTIESCCRPGDFVASGDVLVRVPEGLADDEAFEGRVRACIALGRERTPEQNCAFLVDELVEILARALSPGVNDPFTAISCIHWLRAGLTQVLDHDDPSPVRADDDGCPRLRVPVITFDALAERALGAPMQYVASDRNAALAMLEALGKLARDAERPERRETILAYGRSLLRAAEKVQRVEHDVVMLRQAWHSAVCE